MLEGTAERLENSSDSRDQSVLGQSSSFDRSQSYDASDSLYQAGTMNAGNYANTSYSYQDSADISTAYAADGPGQMVNELWTQERGADVQLSGSSATSVATYTFERGTGPQTGGNSAGGTPAGPADSPVVQFAQPDQRLVPVLGAAQMAGTDMTTGNGSSPLDPTPLSGSGAAAGGGVFASSLTPGPAANGGAALGVNAPVPVNINPQVVAIGGKWMKSTHHASRQIIVTGASSQHVFGSVTIGGRTYTGDVSRYLPAGALSFVFSGMDGNNFGMQAWKALRPVMKLAGYLGGDEIERSVQGLLALADDTGYVANYFNKPVVSSSNDPYVQWVDQILTSHGGLLYAGAAPIYGTYFDPRSEAGLNLILGGGSNEDFITVATGPSSQEGRGAAQAMVQAMPMVETLTMVSLVANYGTTRLNTGVRTPRYVRGQGPCTRLNSRRIVDSCFAGDIEVLTARGFVRWDTLTEKDQVASRDENDPDGPIEFKQVEEIFRPIGRIWHVHVEGRVVRTTGEHPFYVDGLGWVPARLLLPGYLCRSHTGRMAAVEDVFDTGVEEDVYNCRVADYHTYFVGGDEWQFTVWAHNACSSTSGETAKAATGRAKHEAFKRKVAAKGWNPNPSAIDPKTGRTVRPDALTPRGRPIELKPRTPSGIRAGRRQMDAYERAFGRRGRVVYY